MWIICPVKLLLPLLSWRTPRADQGHHHHHHHGHGSNWDHNDDQKVAVLLRRDAAVRGTHLTNRRVWRRHREGRWRMWAVLGSEALIKVSVMTDEGDFCYSSCFVSEMWWKKGTWKFLRFQKCSFHFSIAGTSCICTPHFLSFWFLKQIHFYCLPIKGFLWFCSFRERWRMTTNKQ